MLFLITDIVESGIEHQ